MIALESWSFEIRPSGSGAVDAVFVELAGHLEIGVDDALERFTPATAEMLVRYHRRQHARRQAARQLASRLGVDVEAVYAACTDEGPMLLLLALDAA